MKEAFAEVQRLVAANAKHRKGHRLGEVSDDFVLMRAGEELQELRDAPDDSMEMADTFGALFHYMVRKGWTLERIEKEVIYKLSIRFTIPEEAKV